MQRALCSWCFLLAVGASRFRTAPLHQRAQEAIAAASAASASADAAARDAQKTLVAGGHAPAAQAFHVHVDLGREEERHPFEGIGALSAGASSRLLRDYPDVQRGEILDLLFKPGHGAALQVLKVEIGGDMQSTDGSEPSHMRVETELPNCKRGYETWLLQEAKLRNPKIKLYGLAWGVPGWIGNGSYFTLNNVHYHVSWLECVRATFGFEVDYLGIWNEMPWGEVWYIDSLAREIASRKLSTRLVLLDAIHGVDAHFLEFFSRNATFRQLVDAVGLHYPCEAPAPLTQVLATQHNARFWASEELSTVADWGGAGCWGRMINQNFVRMNATSSIAWSLVWSAYPNLECFGNGLLYAFEPWSGHYEVTPPVWTTAHTTQFTEVGWEYLPVGHGAGLLPGGGTFVTLVSPGLHDFTMVLETLQGQCFYHAGCPHTHEAETPQRLRLLLEPRLVEVARAAGPLEVWATNREKWFVRRPDVAVDASGALELTLEPDAIVTLTTVRRSEGRKSPARPPPLSQAFPLPYHENFDSAALGREPRFFADQGGAFEVVAAEGPARGPLRSFGVNRVLEQQVLTPPIAWIGHSPEPFTLLGGVNWTDVSAEVEVSLGPRPSAHQSTKQLQLAASQRAGLCVRISRYQFFGGASAVPEGYCLELTDKAHWRLAAADQPLAAGPLGPEDAKHLLDRGWVRLRLEARGARLRALVQGHEVASVLDTAFPFGQVALRCGYHRCQFDELAIAPLEAPQHTSSTLLHVELAAFVYNSRSCDPAPRLARRRKDFTGFVGFAFEVKAELTVRALGRMVVTGGHPWAQVHNVSLFATYAAGARPVATVALSTAEADQVGVIETEDGWVFAELRTPVVLHPGQKYLLASSELANGDVFYDKAVEGSGNDGVFLLGPAYLDTAGWHVSHEAPTVYGPLNALIGPSGQKLHSARTA